MRESHNVWRYFTQLVNRVDYRHAITNRHITSTRRADGGLIRTIFQLVIGRGTDVFSYRLSPSNP